VSRTTGLMPKSRAARLNMAKEWKTVLTARKAVRSGADAAVSEPGDLAGARKPRCPLDLA
jgi:hypothetical protein